VGVGASIPQTPDAWMISTRHLAWPPTQSDCRCCKRRPTRGCLARLRPRPARSPAAQEAQTCKSEFGVGFGFGVGWVELWVWLRLVAFVSWVSAIGAFNDIGELCFWSHRITCVDKRIERRCKESHRIKCVHSLGRRRSARSERPALGPLHTARPAMYTCV
jgi:hypothetical protein